MSSPLATTSSSRLHSISTFLANDELIEIIPNFTYDKQFGMISRLVGPFSAGVRTNVPLWLALTLHRKGLAKIIPPSWMDIDVLSRVLQHDNESSSFSPELPYNYVEISREILKCCFTTIHPQVKMLLNDIRTIRLDKIRKNLHTLSEVNLRGTAGGNEEVPMIDVTNIGSMEMHVIRPFLTQVFRDHLELLRRKKEQEPSGGRRDVEEVRQVRSSGNNLRRFRNDMEE